MKIILVGSHGTVGKNITKLLREAHHEIIEVGRKTGQYQLNLEDPESIIALYKKVGRFDALINASGEVVFEPLQNITPQHWASSFESKLLGQIRLVQLGTNFISDGGSFTLISGILGDEQILMGTIAATINSALAGFVKAAARELPRQIRINLVSPTVLEEAMSIYGDFFQGFKPVSGHDVALAFNKALRGIETGRVIKVGY